jgi:uncharacterized protein (TIGR02145 family)
MRYVSTLFAFSLLSVGLAQVPEYVPSEGLVAWYPFNGNAQDESGNGHHAAIDGATLADDRYGNFDAAFYFDGSDRIIAPQNVSPQGNSARTINAFFNSYTALPVGNNPYSLQAIFGSGSAAAGKVISTLNIDGNGTNNGHIPRTGHLYFSSGSWQDEAWSQESVSDSHWHMATMTYEGPNTPVRVYLDGQFQDQTDPITLNTHLSDFYIGDVPWAVLFFNGLIDDLGVWNRALTDEEILALLGPEVPSGCTDTDACNFNDDAVVDDGSCIPSGCTDSYACNFDAESGCDDGSCDYSCCPGPGCCDQGLTWNWELSLCQNLNPADINLDGCVQLNDLLDLLSAYGNCAADESAWLCGDPLEYQGYDYETVQIGEQCWFAENARFLPEVSPSSLGSEVDGLPHAYVYGYDGSVVSEAVQSSGYANGALYNFDAVISWEICPAGWYVPSDEDWMTLESFLGMDENELEWFYPEQGFERGADEEIGFKLKSVEWDGGNSAGFSALSNGWRWAGVFAYPEYTNFWTSTQISPEVSWARILREGESGIARQPYYPHFGKSVRCVQESE